MAGNTTVSIGSIFEETEAIDREVQYACAMTL